MYLFGISIFVDDWFRLVQATSRADPPRRDTSVPIAPTCRRPGSSRCAAVAIEPRPHAHALNGQPHRLWVLNLIRSCAILCSELPPHGRHANAGAEGVQRNRTRFDVALRLLPSQVAMQDDGADDCPSTDRLEEAVSLAHHHDAVMTCNLTLKNGCTSCHVKSVQRASSRQRYSLFDSVLDMKLPSCSAGDWHGQAARGGRLQHAHRRGARGGRRRCAAGPGSPAVAEVLTASVFARGAARIVQHCSGAFRYVQRIGQRHGLNVAKQ